MIGLEASPPCCSPPPDHSPYFSHPWPLLGPSELLRVEGLLFSSIKRQFEPSSLVYKHGEPLHTVTHSDHCQRQPSTGFIPNIERLKIIKIMCVYVCFQSLQQGHPCHITIDVSLVTRFVTATSYYLLEERFVHTYIPWIKNTLDIHLPQHMSEVERERVHWKADVHSNTFDSSNSTQMFACIQSNGRLCPTK